MRELTTIIIHNSDTYPDMNIGVSEIREWHVNGNGWSDIGYHFVIRRDGTIEVGRPIEIVGAHAKGKNTGSIGICLVGGKARGQRHPTNFTMRQFLSLNTLVVDLQAEHGPLLVIGHNDVSTKICPGLDARELWT